MPGSAKKPHTSTLHVRFYELDPYNHLNHAVYVQYFEVARINLLNHVSFGMDVLEEMGYRLVVTEINTKYLASAGPGDEVVVETSIAAVRRVSSQWWQRMTRGDDLLATQLVTAAVTNQTGRPTRFPPELVAALEPFVLEP